MNITELNRKSREVIDAAIMNGEDPDDVLVSIQISDIESGDVWSDSVEIIYDGDCQASGCVILGWKNQSPSDKVDHNLRAWVLGEVAREAGKPRRKDVGDLIDRGLILERLLKEKGFKLVEFKPDADTKGK